MVTRVIETGNPGVHRIGRYDLVAEIASGGMATVHFGRLDGAGGFARVVAIKRLLPHLIEDRDFTEMLLKEARLAARVRHPNVAATLDVVATKGDVLLVLDYVHGEALSTLCRTQAKERKEQVPLPIAIGILLDMLAGLGAIHDATDEKGRSLGLVHRDISPPNVLVGADGAARVLDFGIATALEHIEETSHGRKGKRGYMSPEQLRGERVTQRSDVFAAGVVMWEVLAMRRLFSAETEKEPGEAVLRGQYPGLSQYRPELEPELVGVVMRAISLDPLARYASMHELAEALESAAPPRANARRIGEWVLDLARDALAERTRMVARVENWVSDVEIPLKSTPFAAELPLRPRSPSSAPPAADVPEADARPSSAPPLPASVSAAPAPAPAPRSIKPGSVPLGSASVRPSLKADSVAPPAQNFARVARSYSPLSLSPTPTPMKPPRPNPTPMRPPRPTPKPPRPEAPPSVPPAGSSGIPVPPQFQIHSELDAVPHEVQEDAFDLRSVHTQREPLASRKAQPSADWIPHAPASAPPPPPQSETELRVRANRTSSPAVTILVDRTRESTPPASERPAPARAAVPLSWVLGAAVFAVVLALIVAFALRPDAPPQAVSPLDGRPSAAAPSTAEAAPRDATPPLAAPGAKRAGAASATRSTSAPKSSTTRSASSAAASASAAPASSADPNSKVHQSIY